MNRIRLFRVLQSITLPSIFLVLPLLFGFILPIDRAEGATITGLYNTGVDEFGQVLPAGSPELHYSMLGPISSAIVTVPNPLWVAAPQGSAWIGPTNGSVTDPLGDYIYSLSFEITGYDPNTEFASIKGDYAGDNTTRILLNGQDTGYVANNLLQLEPFEIIRGFVPGINTLEFVVTNNPGSGGNPSGLLVANLSGTISPVPIPAAVWLFLTSIIGLASISTRSKKVI